MSINGPLFLVLWFGLLAVNGGVSLLLYFQGFPGAATGTSVALGVAHVLCTIYGLIRWWDVRWVARVGRVVLAVVVAQALAYTAWLSGSMQTVIAIGTILAMGLTAYFALLGVKALLAPAHPIFGVARTTLDEAVRGKTALIAVVMLVVFIPLLPLMLDPQEPLKYRIQFFLTWAMIATSVLLSVMTIFLACWTITSELDRKLVYGSLTKPVARWQHLAGKWLGLAALNLVLVGVAGAATYGTTKYLEQEKYKLPEMHVDRIAIDEQVLVARRYTEPLPGVDGGLEALVDQRIAQVQSQDPTLAQNINRDQVRQEVIRDWYALGPYETQTYVFTGLGPSKQLTRTIQLRLKPKASGMEDDRVQLAMRLNGRTYEQLMGRSLPRMSVRNAHVLDLPTWIIDDNGVLVVDMANPPVAGQTQKTIAFDNKEGLAVLYRTGSFEVNLVRALGLIWLRTVFLTMLGLACGTMLSFPVACLLAFLLFAAGAGTEYLGEAFEYYADDPPASATLGQALLWYPLAIVNKLAEGEIWDGVKIIISLVGQGFLALVPAFGEFTPVDQIKNGVEIAWSRLGAGVLWIGVIWSGLAAAIGWLLYSRRELARVTV